MDVPAHLAHLLGEPAARIDPLGPSHAWTLYRARTTDGRTLFIKARNDGDPTAALTAEAAGLRWLAQAHPDLVPPVLAADPHMLVLPWHPPEPATPTAAEHLGHALATLHTATPDTYGAPGPATSAPCPSTTPPPPAHGATGTPDTGSPPTSPPPHPNSAATACACSNASSTASTTSPDPRTTRPHPRRPLVRKHPVDPRPRPAHRARRPRRTPRNRPRHARPLRHTPPRPHPRRLPGNHTPESRLRQRIPLHQLHPLLVHVVLFGGSYRGMLLAAASAALAN